MSKATTKANQAFSAFVKYLLRRKRTQQQADLEYAVMCDCIDLATQKATKIVTSSKEKLSHSTHAFYHVRTSDHLIIVVICTDHDTDKSYDRMILNYAVTSLDATTCTGHNNNDCNIVSHNNKTDMNFQILRALLMCA